MPFFMKENISIYKFKSYVFYLVLRVKINILFFENHQLADSTIQKIILDFIRLYDLGGGIYKNLFLLFFNLSGYPVDSTDIIKNTISI